MNSDRIQRLMGEAMGPQAPLTRAEERAALAGTITLIVVAAIAMVEILVSQPPQRPPAAASGPSQQAQPSEGRNSMPPTPAGVAARAP